MRTGIATGMRDDGNDDFQQSSQMIEKILINFLCQYKIYIYS